MSTDSLADLVRLAAKLNIRPNLIYKLLRLHYIDPLEPKTHKFFFFRGDFDLLQRVKQDFPAAGSNRCTIWKYRRQRS
jgi:hypothetical protein